MRRCGIRMPWLRPDSTLSAIAYNATDILLPLICFYQFVLTASSAFRTKNFQDICAIGVAAPLEGTGVAIYIFYIIYQKRLQKFIDNWNNLNMKIHNKLGHAELFKEIYLDVTRHNLSFAKRVLFIAFCTPLIYCIPIIIGDVVNNAYRTSFPVPIIYPYDFRQPGLYELTFGLHVIGVTTAVVLKIGNDCFILALVNIQSVYLKWLSAFIKSLGEQFKNRDDRLLKRKQVMWIKFHAELLRDVNELIAIYTPIIVLYYFYLMIVVVCGLFTQIKSEHDNAIQGMGIGGFGLINIFQLYMHSSSAEELAIEAEKLAQEVYNVPWYKMDKSNAGMLRLTLLMAKKPIQVTAFRASTFLLNKETFIAFVLSSVTALMTLSKINDLHEH